MTIHLKKALIKLQFILKIKEYSHIARQLKNGQWTSKVGDLEDISHKTLEILERTIIWEIRGGNETKNP